MTSEVFEYVDWLFENPGDYVAARMDNDAWKTMVDSPCGCPCTFLWDVLEDASSDCPSRVSAYGCRNCDQAITYERLYTALLENSKWSCKLADRVCCMTLVLIHYEVEP